jgi:hypothetical protein
VDLVAHQTVDNPSIFPGSREKKVDLSTSSDATPATAAPQIRGRGLAVADLPAGAHLEHDNAMIMISSDTPTAALMFGHDQLLSS